MSYLHDATPTWNGFNYQGKIALLVVFDTLIELLKKGDNICEYSLELEWLEDFSIKKNNNYISIHQVKNYGDSSLNSYSEALLSMICKSMKAITPNELTQIITQKGVNKDQKVIIAELIFKQLEDENLIDSNITTFTDEQLLNFKFSDEISKKFNSPANALERLKNVLSHHSDISKNCDELQYSYLHIAEEVSSFSDTDIKSLEIIKTSRIFSNIGFDSVLATVKLYDYGSNTYCSNDDIMDYLTNRLRETIEIIDKETSPNYPKFSADYLAKSICLLLSIIDQNVSSRHQAIRDKSTSPKSTIAFEDFLSSIRTNHNQSDSYDSYLLKQIYTTSLEEYLKEHKGKDDVCEFLTNVSDEHLTKNQGVNLIKFCQQISPHCNTPNIKSTLLDDNGLRNSFFNFFSKCVAHNNLDINIKDKSSETYIITTIHEGEFGIERQKSMYQRIKKNSKSIPYNFNVENFAGSIGKGGGGKKFDEIVPNQTKASSDFQNKDPNNKITIAENFKLIDINDLIERM